MHAVPFLFLFGLLALEVDIFFHFVTRVFNAIYGQFIKTFKKLFMGQYDMKRIEFSRHPIVEILQE